MSFDPITQPVDYILLAGQRSPGIAEISGASSPRRWDERKGFAQTGARVVFRGVGLAHFVVTLRLLTTQDWADWHAWRELVQRPPIGTYARAQDIWHPILEDLEVASAVVEDVGQPRQTGDGEWSIDIKFIEYRTPIPRIEPINGSEERPRRLTGNELELERNRLEIQVREAGGDDRQVARVLAEHARIQSQIGAAP